MSWGAVAVVAVGSISAYVSHEDAQDATEAQEAATNAAAEVSNEQLQFQMDLQARWDEIFGPTQDNLANYYNNLNPKDLAATQIQNVQAGYQNYQTQLNQTLAQRGLDTSGLGAELASQAMYSNQMQQASIRANAPAEVANQQSQFLALGMGQAGAIQSGVSNAYGNQIGLYNNQANMAALQQQQANAGLIAGIGAIGQGTGYFFNNQNASSINRGIPTQQDLDYVNTNYPTTVGTLAQ